MELGRQAMTEDRNERAYRLALLRAPTVGPVTFSELVERFGSARAVFTGGVAEGTLPAPLRAYLGSPDWPGVDADEAWAASPDCHILVAGEKEYPSQLAAIASPPPLLFVRGAVEALHQPQLAMVGSRNPTASGRETAMEFARHLARVGLGITSGLALGIDAASHDGAIAGDGQTIAVMGTGADRIYPARHRDLAHRIVDHGGALVSEFPTGTAPLPAHFPRRNRIISGLALGTLVVEAAPRSGSLITARSAAEQGRDVFAIPGSIHNPLARGCHRLIRDGAKLVETATDVLEELAPQLRELILDAPEQVSPQNADLPSEELDPDYQRLLESLDYAPTPVDLLVDRSGLTADVVSSMLLLLELEGYIEAVPGGRYSRTRKRV